MLRRFHHLLTMFFAVGMACVLMAIDSPLRAQEEERIAFVIGNGDYNADGDYDDKDDLDDVPRDASLIADTLRKLNFRVTELHDLDLDGMENALAKFAREIRGPKKVGFFYYAGHGVQVRNQNYLIPVQANIHDVHEFAYKAYNAEKLMSVFNFAENDLNIAVLDACRNNPYRGLFRSPTRGLIDLKPEHGSLIAYSTAPNAIAADDGVYARSLAEHLLRPGLHIESVFKAVTAEVKSRSNGQQEPWHLSSLSRDFKIAGPANSPVRDNAAATIETTLQLTRGERRSIQASLNRLGHNVGFEDGLFGDRTRDGIRQYQRAEDEAETGYLTARQAKALLAPHQTTARSNENSRQPASGTAFQDCPECPEMVVIPGGTFLMGSPEDEPGRDNDEGPQREVTVPAFAMGKYEVTFAEWDACLADGGCGGYKPDDQGWGRGDRPVINVSWDDAQKYIHWLNTKVDGTPYSLPSEAEWEYAARASASTAYPWGAEWSEWDAARANGAFSAGRTRKVGAYPANSYSLHDTIGNVWEWVQDDYRDTFEDAPRDGDAWFGGRGKKVLRGGSWISFPRYLRTANRNVSSLDNRSNEVGFRVARALAP